MCISDNSRMHPVGIVVEQGIRPVADHLAGGNRLVDRKDVGLDWLLISMQAMARPRSSKSATKS